MGRACAGQLALLHAAAPLAAQPVEGQSQDSGHLSFAGPS